MLYDVTASKQPVINNVALQASHLEGQAIEGSIVCPTEQQEGPPIVSVIQRSNITPQTGM